MRARKTIKGVLASFLGTYTSRYSDYDGYWLFGFIVADLAELRIDLLTPIVGELDSPHGVAVRIAVANFRDQLRKAGLNHPQVQEASLTIRKLLGTAEGLINGRLCHGYTVEFVARAAMDNGRRHERAHRVFVAPHNAKIESRSARAPEVRAACQ